MGGLSLSHCLTELDNRVARRTCPEVPQAAVCRRTAPGERGCFWGGKLGWGVSVGSVPMSLPGLHHHGPEP